MKKHPWPRKEARIMTMTSVIAIDKSYLLKLLEQRNRKCLPSTKSTTTPSRTYIGTNHKGYFQQIRMNGKQAICIQWACMLYFHVLYLSRRGCLVMKFSSVAWTVTCSLSYLWRLPWNMRNRYRHVNLVNLLSQSGKHCKSLGKKKKKKDQSYFLVRSWKLPKRQEGFASRCDEKSFAVIGPTSLRELHILFL